MTNTVVPDQGKQDCMVSEQNTISLFCGITTLIQVTLMEITAHCQYLMSLGEEVLNFTLQGFFSWFFIKCLPSSWI